MTQGKNFKKPIRARMAETGEIREVPGPKHYDRVKELCRGIHERNKFRSRVCTDDEGYHELVALGPEAVPALLRRIEDCRATDLLYDGMAVWEPIAALYAITKTSPVSDEHAGKLGAIIDDWLEWGRREGHEW